MDKNIKESGTKTVGQTQSTRNLFSAFINILSPRRIFTPLFWKAFFILSLASIFLYTLEFLRFSTFDKEFSYRYLVLVLLSLFEWSFCISLDFSCYGVRRGAPVMCIPLLFIAMDYSNKVMIGKYNLYCTIFFSMQAGSILMILDLLAYSFRFRILSCLRTLLFSISLVFPLLVIGNRVLTGGVIDTEAMLAIQQTTLDEAYHFFFGLNHGVFLLIWLAVLLAAIVCIVRFVFSPGGRIPLTEEKKSQINKSVVLCLLSLLPCVAIGYLGHMYAFTPHIYQILSFPVRYSQSLKQFKELRETREKELQKRIAAINGQSGFNGKFVLVIGESLNRNNMGCYGYQKDTTPFQTNARKSDNFVFFDKCFACHVQTQRVLLLLLTDRNQYNGKTIDVLESTSIIDLAKASGYYTAWLSGQERISRNNSVISALAEESDFVVYPNPKRKSAYCDQDSVQLLDDVLPHERAFVVIHLIGNHYPYYLKYPADMQFDDPDLSMYDKSVFFNDLIMSQAFEKIRKNNVDVMMYVSDHSEALITGKGHDPRKYSQEMAEIPLWIYMSDKYKEEHPEIVKQLHKAAEQVVTNDLVFDLMLLLMGIDDGFTDATLTPGNDSYRIDANSARTLYGKEKIIINK